MDELVFLKNDEALTDSISVAEMFNKRHSDVMRAIDNKLKNDSTQNCVKCFTKTKYKDASGRWVAKYLMNKDGFTVLAFGFTGKKAEEWRWKYIDAFNKMKAILEQKSTEAWIENRKRGMLTRKEECDTIKKLVEYAKEQGSTHSDMLYMTYTKLANVMSGVKSRDQATSHQLDTLNFMENIILHMVEEGIEAGTYYKQIYRNCKERIEKVKELGYIEVSA